MADRDFELQLKGYGLLTAEIFYFLPDYPSLLQQYVWQEYDEAPDYPVLFGFLDHWRREIEAAIHSVRIAHDRSLGAREIRKVDGVFTLQ
ncbi:usg protein [Erythrobacter sp. JK5]|uniref:usg protein n=1 Tax=Erythrobacter sp. JK5 TaxID=2829500 RepID=UPI001BACC8CF|nr:protein usg [Erythrobacter sp. JK5]QUL37918.1 protein usg [Erythrobacter sp. JK5]